MPRKYRRNDNLFPSDSRVCRTIECMGVDEVTVVRIEREVNISIYRSRDCGNIKEEVCAFLAKRFPGRCINLMVGPKVGTICCNAFIRPPGESHFYSCSVPATKSRLGLSRV